jgi:hypothetical protein
MGIQKNPLYVVIATDLALRGSVAISVLCGEYEIASVVPLGLPRNDTFRTPYCDLLYLEAGSNEYFLRKFLNILQYKLLYSFLPPKIGHLTQPLVSESQLKLYFRP